MKVARRGDGGRGVGPARARNLGVDGWLASNGADDAFYIIEGPRLWRPFAL